MQNILKCSECMKNAPSNHCCKTVCGTMVICENCTSPVRGGPKCPNDDRYFDDDRKEETKSYESV